MSSDAHEVCCAGGCGAVLEDRAGNVVRAAHRRFENTTTDGVPILLVLCEACAAEHDSGLDRGVRMT